MCVWGEGGSAGSAESARELAANQRIKDGFGCG